MVSGTADAAHDIEAALELLANPNPNPNPNPNQVKRMLLLMDTRLDELASISEE